MDKNFSEIKKTLLEKSSVKQLVFRQSKIAFNELRKTVKNIANELSNEIYTEDPNVEVKFYDKSEFEFHLKFSGDTLVFMMHTNVFDFESSHFIHQSAYVKEDHFREYCGMIQMYNFLADSIKYNREGDMGYLVGRLFINKDQHFFIEGKRPISFLFNDFSKCEINDETLSQIVAEAMKFCLNFDLTTPPLDIVNLITVEQKNMMSFSSGIPTAKQLGFRMEKDERKEEY
jgi:hypothetical protein